jgi:hypothetical protein
MQRHLFRSRVPALALALASLGAGAGCIDENEAVVFVEASIESPTAAVAGSTLGTELDGSFVLRLILGPRASGPSDVALQSFEITNADQTASIVAPLPVTAEAPSSLRVDLDSEVTATIPFSTGAEPKPAELRDQLCNPAGIKIAGTVQDSLQDGATPVASAVFSANCM